MFVGSTNVHLKRCGREKERNFLDAVFKKVNLHAQFERACSLLVVSTLALNATHSRKIQILRVAFWCLNKSIQCVFFAYLCYFRYCVIPLESVTCWRANGFFFQTYRQINSSSFTNLFSSISRNCMLNGFRKQLFFRFSGQIKNLYLLLCSPYIFNAQAECNYAF